jgi:DNA polymerase-3 subunit epsilon
MEQRTLGAAYKFYCDKDLENAHSAEADAVATYEILESQLDKYKDVLENDVKFLSDFSTKSKFIDYAGRIIMNENDEPTFNFGKHKGKTVENVFKTDLSYYSWMMNGDFTLDTKQVITELKLGFENKPSR